MPARTWLFAIFLALVVPRAFADLDVIEGEWTNSSNLIAITRAQSFGWNLWQDNRGRASIVQSPEGGGNITVTFKGGIVCSYYVSTTNRGQKMVWNLQSPPNASGVCLNGTFERVDVPHKVVGEQVDSYVKSPAHPIDDGDWDLRFQCNDRHPNRGGVLTFSTGRSAEGDSLLDPIDSNGRFTGEYENDIYPSDLNLGYIAGDEKEIRLIGIAGRTDNPISFVGSKNSDGTYSGTGKWGTIDCTFKAAFMAKLNDREVLLPRDHHPLKQTVSVFIKCSSDNQYRFDNIALQRGVGGFGYKSSSDSYITALFGMSFENKSYTSGNFKGYLYGETTDDVDFKITQQSKTSATTTFNGTGKVGSQENCSISITSMP